ncbi:MAG: DNA-binding response regulator [Actinomycetia bacterium]|nr:DNA-binding response regulator [Actinomycetes bacterium]
MHVLLCDDESAIRLLFRTAFERLGATVTEAADGHECLIFAAVGAPDLVVLDLMMPGGDGLNALPELRRLLPTAAVFVVSAHAEPEIMEQGVAWGADACFDKLTFLRRIPELLVRLGVAV